MYTKLMPLGKHLLLLKIKVIEVLLMELQIMFR